MSKTSLVERINELENQIESIQRTLNNAGGQPITINRRRFLLITGGAALLGGGTGNALGTHGQLNPDDPHGVAYLIGSGDPPSAGSRFFSDKRGYEFVYLDRSDGTRWHIRAGDGSWSVLPLTTDQVLNSAIGDSVDYIHPDWQAKTSAISYVSFFESLDGINESTNGSASILLASTLVELSTGGTSSSIAEIVARVYGSAAIADPTFDKDRVLSVGIDIRDNDGSRTDWMTCGSPRQGSQGFGFKINSGDLLGATHDGTAENTTTLVSNPGTGQRRLEARFVSGTDITFLVDGTQQGTLSSNLPSGTSEADRFIRASVTNSTAADRRLAIGGVRAVQAP